ncbi:putative ribonuclease H protein [Citrus sinensis]|uniref:Ribonuclease H protein n=1 Tax=Citrus sinensis TaxID=2711 RepID=A0ACB8HZM5_CITSI|nr:putative ribonuclease H protein [Citrus sinensis]
MKICWGLISSTESLWIKVLRTKYGISSLYLQADLPSTNCSYLWRSVSKLLNKTLKGAGWSISNGKETRFWWDYWTTKTHSLIDYAIVPVREDILHGNFTVRSAYHYLAGSRHEDKDSSWLLAWRWNGPQAICVFISIVLHDRLKTKRELMRRHFASNGYCDRCGLDLESTLHFTPVTERRNLREGYKSVMTNPAASGNISSTSGTKIILIFALVTKCCPRNNSTSHIPQRKK